MQSLTGSLQYELYFFVIQANFDTSYLSKHLGSALKIKFNEDVQGINGLIDFFGLTAQEVPYKYSTTFCAKWCYVSYGLGRISKIWKWLAWHCHDARLFYMI